MTPLILPALHDQLTREAANGRSPPFGQIIVTMRADGQISVDCAVPSRIAMNGLMMTAHQDLIQAFLEAERKQQGGIEAMTDPEMIERLNGYAILKPPRKR